MYISVPSAQAPLPTADSLYADRTNLASARRAADMWQAALRDAPRSFEFAWKLSRADYWLGNHAPEHERRKFLESGIDVARQAIAIDTSRPEGHFWLAANMGALAESFGLRAGLKYRKPIREELEIVKRISPSFMNGSADRALGRWYFKVPGLFGGSHERAVQHLQTSLTYDPDSTVSLYFLAEVWLDDGKKAEARRLLERILEVSSSEEWEPEDRDYKARAKALLAKMK